MFDAVSFQAFEDVYLDENIKLKEALNYMNIVFCVLFSIEMVLKWFAYGVTKYFTSFWTLLDFVIVVVGRCFFYILCI